MTVPEAAATATAAEATTTATAASTGATTTTVAPGNGSPRRNVPSRVLITGANTGIGWDCARQLASFEGDAAVEAIWLACRNEAKAKLAKDKLVQVTGKSPDLFQIVLMDVSDLASVRQAVTKLCETEGFYVDGLVLNAGGLGGTDPFEVTEAGGGVTSSMAVNVLGHVVLVDELIKAKKLRGRGGGGAAAAASVIFSGSEAARGVGEMSVTPPALRSGSVEEFASICDGTFFTKDASSVNDLYGHCKMVAALWMSSMARRHHPNIRFVTISPGFTAMADGPRDMPFLKRWCFIFLFKVLTLIGKCNTLETGAKRYVDALVDRDGAYQSGIFYASEAGRVVGPVCDQSDILSYFSNEEYQTNASAALHSFIKVNNNDNAN